MTLDTATLAARIREACERTERDWKAFYLSEAAGAGTYDDVSAWDLERIREAFRADDFEHYDQGSEVGEAVEQGIGYENAMADVLRWLGEGARDRLEYLRGELRAERISYGELAELQGLAPFIAAGDVELLEAAGVPEFPEEES